MEQYPSVEMTISRLEATHTEATSTRCPSCAQLQIFEHQLTTCPDCTATTAIMRLLDMQGPRSLSDATIETTVTRVSPGNYALGYLVDGVFNVFYVGRSDADVRRRLHQWVDAPSCHPKDGRSEDASWGLSRWGHGLGNPCPGVDTPYSHFAYSYARTAEDAYAKEWRNYDAFGGGDGLDNDRQPVLAAGTAAE